MSANDGTIKPTKEQAIEAVQGWKNGFPTRPDIAEGIIRQARPEESDLYSSLYQGRDHCLRKHIDLALLGRLLERLVEEGALISMKGSEIATGWYWKQHNAKYYFTPETLDRLREDIRLEGEAVRREKARSQAVETVLSKHKDEVEALTEQYLAADDQQAKSNESNKGVKQNG